MLITGHKRDPAAMNFDDLGLNASRLIAGFGGGLVHALVFKKNNPYAVAGSVLTGTITANFLAPAAAHYAPTWVGGSGVAFLVGLTAMAICQGAAAMVRAKLGIPPERKL